MSAIRTTTRTTRRAVQLCGLAAAFGFACSGEVQTDGVPSGPGVVPSATTGPNGDPVLPPGEMPPPDTGIAPVAACATNGTLEANLPRRLNRSELNNLARDTFGTTTDPFNNLSNDQNAKAAGTSLTVTGAFAELYQTAALEVAAEYIMAANPVQTCGGTPNAECALSILKPLGERMMRRRMTPELETKLMAITQTALAGQLSFEEGLTDSILALFLFPDTLYMDTRVTPAAGLFSLDAFSIAERLALAVWNSVPDEELLAAADSGATLTQEGLSAQLTRMLADTDKGDRFIEQFAHNFLTLDSMEPLTQDVPEGFAPEAWAELVRDMATESEMFMHDAFMNNSPINDFATARHSFINQRLADHYGLAEEYAAAGGTGGFVKVSLPETEPRLGLTTQGFFMARLGHHPLIFRGKEFRLQFMCGTLPGNPEDPTILAAIDEQLANQEGKTEEELAAERATGGCAGCHALLDPLGRAYNTFDSVGRVTGAAAQTKYLGTDIDGSVGAANYIANSDGYGACMVGHVIGPVSNRLVATAKNQMDRCIADGVIQSLGPNPGFQDLLVGTLNSQLFKTRMVGE